MPVELSDNLVTIPNVTIVETGDWVASSGPVTFVEDDLRAAVAALDDPMIKSPRLRVGHTMPAVGAQQSADGFASQPNFGKFTNLRVSDDGQSLVADMVGVPKWLAEIMPIAYPNRSVEAFWDVKTSGGTQHRLVIASVALLGVELPAVESLEDLQFAFSAESPDDFTDLFIEGERVAASRGGGAMPGRVAASVQYEDVRRAFYTDFAVDDRYWWWIHSMYVEPAMLIADDDESGFWAVPYTTSGNDVEFGDAVQVRQQFVAEDGGKVMASTAPPAIQYSKAESRPNDRRKEKNNMSLDMTALRQRLGLPEDATEDQINTALAEQPEPTPDPDPAPTDDPAPGADPEPTDDPEAEPEGEPAEDPEAAVTAAGVTVDAGAFERLQQDAKAGRDARARQIQEDDERLLGDAVKAGKFPPSRKDHYKALLSKDRQGTTEFIESLPEGTIPVEEIGTAASSETGTAGYDETLLTPRERERVEAARAGAPVPERVMSEV